MSGATFEIGVMSKASATEHSRRALIAAPAGTDTRIIRQTLARHGVATFTADELALPGLTLSEIIREAVGRADFVVAVVRGGPAPNGLSNVFFELGFAVAMKKRTMLIAGADADIPFDLSGIPYLRAAPTDSAAIEYGLSRLVSAPRVTPPVSDRTAAETHGLGAQSDQLLARFRSGGPAITGPQLVEIVAEAIRGSGVSILSDQSKHLRADLAVWSDDLEPWISNPLVIEVRLRIVAEGDVESLLQTLDATLPAARATWAFVIYREARRELIEAISQRPILTISVEQFLEALRDQSFGALVLHLRNARVHGG